MDWQAYLTIAVIVSIAVALVRDLARPDLIFLAALGLLLVAGVITPSEAFAGFSNGAVIALGSLFVVAAGIEKSGLLRRFERQLLRRVSNLSKALFRLMIPTALVSAFMNNTPVVAIWTQPVQRWAYRSRLSPSKLLIPLSYAAIAGGMITLIGSSTNVVVSGLAQDAGHTLALFDFTMIGLPAAVIVLIFMAFFGVRLLPDRASEPPFTRSRLEKCLFEVRVTRRSPLIGQTLKQAGLDVGDESAVIVQIRRGKHVMAFDPQIILDQDDVLCFSGSLSVLEDLLNRPGFGPGRAISEQRLGNLLPMYEAVISETSYLIGKSLAEVDFLAKYGAVVLAVQHKSGVLEGAGMRDTTLKAGDLLLVGAVAGFEERWHASHLEFFYVVPRGVSRRKFSRARMVTSVSILAAMVLAISTGRVPLPTAAFTAALAMVVTRCITVATARNALDLQVLLLIASALGLGVAVGKTGVAENLAQVLTEIGGINPILALIVLYACTNVLTELIANKAAAVLMLPVALSMASTFDAEPKAFILTVAVAAAASFMTPVGYQTNLMVMAAGNYRVRDYLRVGLPVSLLVMLVSTTIISLRWL
ncbi:MAG: SLC13 family permease [Bacteroidetes bacterium]|nr:SLC13 family permease [Bacteroidota bacterium]MDE2671339.1 SLC13 family permease [Bacteroidota bacterium]MDE2826373.1 SLC13 family permease [Bacteroidota bacterium]MXZ04989.1 SLC13 family permease [Rhodothermaceae bacterium]MYF40908.1 SLC13 family permease [Rhodothermaceae bacterium]